MELVAEHAQGKACKAGRRLDSRCSHSTSVRVVPVSSSHTRTNARTPDRVLPEGGALDATSVLQGQGRPREWWWSTSGVAEGLGEPAAWRSRGALQGCTGGVERAGVAAATSAPAFLACSHSLAQSLTNGP
jgi:hypothetical protein